jgi:hypothetical protein
MYSPTRRSPLCSVEKGGFSFNSRRFLPLAPTLREGFDRSKKACYGPDLSSRKPIRDRLSVCIRRSHGPACLLEGLP